MYCFALYLLKFICYEYISMSTYFILIIYGGQNRRWFHKTIHHTEVYAYLLDLDYQHLIQGK